MHACFSEMSNRPDELFFSLSLTSGHSVPSCRSPVIPIDPLGRKVVSNISISNRKFTTALNLMKLTSDSHRTCPSNSPLSANCSASKIQETN